MIAFILFALIGSAVTQFCQSPVCTQEPVFTAPVDGTSTTIICNDPVNECLGCCRAYTISKGFSAASSYVYSSNNGRCVCCHSCN